MTLLDITAKPYFRSTRKDSDLHFKYERGSCLKNANTACTPFKRTHLCRTYGKQVNDQGYFKNSWGESDTSNLVTTISLHRIKGGRKKPNGGKGYDNEVQSTFLNKSYKAGFVETFRSTKMNLAFYVKLNEYQFHHKLITNTRHNTTKSKIQ